jgi:UDP-N-acetylglucosamine diphosphorylase/glucosamine-1-phosphate N-acetyltransferase
MATPRIAFEDQLGRLGPLTDLRSAGEVRSGGRTTLERLAVKAVLAPASLAAGIAARTGAAVNALPKGDRFLLLNTRLLEVPDDARRLTPGEGLQDQADGTLLAACVDRTVAEGWARGQAPEGLALSAVHASMLRRPWDLLANESLERRMLADAEALRAAWKKASELAKPSQVAAFRRGDGKAWTWRFGRRTRPIAFEGDAVFVHADATVDAFAVLDSRAGPVVVEAGAHVGAHAVLQGPVHVARGSIVAPHAMLKPRTVLGPRCRAAGEVGGTIFHGESNKAHDGHLGDALIGRWVNLGAGTVNSNLLNTYGEVSMRVEPEGPLERTGRQFMGCIVGDHVKTAIGTRIMTGTTLGTGAMVACSAPPPACTPRFAWLTDDGQRVHRLDRFLATAEIVMKRRQETLHPTERAALQALHARAAAQGA